MTFLNPMEVKKPRPLPTFSIIISVLIPLFILNRVSGKDLAASL
jgi:hypothetical protein